MPNVRITHSIPADLHHDCDRMHIEGYEMDEVLLRHDERDEMRKAIRVVIRGRNFKAVAQPLVAFVGKAAVQFLRIAPDERSVEGILLEEPKRGAPVEVILGDQDAARHPLAVDPARIVRIT
jgi:hypothetical protein